MTTDDRPCRVRASEGRDLPAIQAIYAWHVEHGLASFEVEAPGADEIAARRRAVIERGYPYLVAERDGAVVGYAYAGPYRARPGYRYTAENSVYVRHGCEGQGVGKALLATLIEQCAACGVRQIVAVIGDSANHASIGLHQSLGFATVGTLRSVGFKFGRWVDSVVMQRAVGAGGATLPE